MVILYDLKLLIMRKVLLFLLVLVFGFELQGNAQKLLTSWEDVGFGEGVSTAEITRALGSVKEFNFHMSRAYDENYRAERIQFVDAKYEYVLSFVSYTGAIGATGFGVEVEASPNRETPNRVVFTIGVSYIGEKIPNVIVDAKVDSDLRIIEADISGGPQTLLKIFKHQWWVSDDDMLAVQKGNKFTISRWDERVTFDWTKSKPIIKIRSNGAGNLRKIIEENE